MHAMFVGSCVFFQFAIGVIKNLFYVLGLLKQHAFVIIMLLPLATALRYQTKHKT